MPDTVVTCVTCEQVLSRGRCTNEMCPGYAPLTEAEQVRPDMAAIRERAEAATGGGIGFMLPSPHATAAAWLLMKDIPDLLAHIEALEAALGIAAELLRGFDFATDASDDETETICERHKADIQAAFQANPGLRRAAELVPEGALLKGGEGEKDGLV